MSEIEIAPCPLCGHEPKLVRQEMSGNIYWHYECEGVIPEHRYASFGEYTAEEAADTWNKMPLFATADRLRPADE